MKQEVPVPAALPKTLLATSWVALGWNEVLMDTAWHSKHALQMNGTKKQSSACVSYQQPTGIARHWYFNKLHRHKVIRSMVFVMCHGKGSSEREMHPIWCLLRRKFSALSGDHICRFPNPNRTIFFAFLGFSHIILLHCFKILRTI